MDTLLGRERERADLAAVLDRVARGPVCLLLRGPAGIGKTALLSVVAEDARARGYRVVTDLTAHPGADRPALMIGETYDDATVRRLILTLAHASAPVEGRHQLNLG